MFLILEQGFNSAYLFSCWVQAPRPIFPLQLKSLHNAIYWQLLLDGQVLIVATDLYNIMPSLDPPEIYIQKLFTELICDRSLKSKWCKKWIDLEFFSYLEVIRKCKIFQNIRLFNGFGFLGFLSPFLYCLIHPLKINRKIGINHHTVITLDNDIFNYLKYNLELPVLYERDLHYYMTVSLIQNNH